MGQAKPQMAAKDLAVFDHQVSAVPWGVAPG